MNRNLYIDVLKAIAIIAVVLYHLGTCEYGYLGVDICNSRVLHCEKR